MSELRNILYRFQHDGTYFMSNAEDDICKLYKKPIKKMNYVIEASLHPYVRVDQVEQYVKESLLTPYRIIHGLHDDRTSISIVGDHNGDLQSLKNKCEFLRKLLNIDTLKAVLKGENLTMEIGEVKTNYYGDD